MLGGGIFQQAADAGSVTDAELGGIDVGVAADYTGEVERPHRSAKVAGDHAGDVGSTGKDKGVAADLSADAQPCRDGRRARRDRKVELSAPAGQEGVIPDQAGNLDSGSRRAQIVQYGALDNDAGTGSPQVSFDGPGRADLDVLGACDQVAPDRAVDINFRRENIEIVIHDLTCGDPVDFIIGKLGGESRRRKRQRPKRLRAQSPTIVWITCVFSYNFSLEAQ